MKAADVEAAVDSVFGLLDKWGHENYIGEQVTQLQHAQQVSCQRIGLGFVKFREWIPIVYHCLFIRIPRILWEPSNDTPAAPQAALQAEQAGYGPQVVVGAFLHDIGDQ